MAGKRCPSPQRLKILIIFYLIQTKKIFPSLKNKQMKKKIQKSERWDRVIICGTR